MVLLHGLSAFRGGAPVSLCVAEPPPNLYQRRAMCKWNVIVKRQFADKTCAELACPLIQLSDLA
jgi:hypothetical protein